mmetsp:Transcript_7402/g.12791  ORF Transcript_7402/g.12791 Transcript_7402/m.12791 type:complete len:188 (-) Transcript_7402:181-744(-)|eukprot:CAMPEP_0198197362 /NCGR_PEP_ID=MMETSP1445-20131203/985_1 /TAXON_ID=36898 /ORGANISM="Pyramimonas sp., Strain CCMP2087" /LENGTH=187 /DNA_ID=CAMNT_0043866633 /DNA_START=110 /DNA_END=673 /DNA_ORIENTATION=-
MRYATQDGTDGSDHEYRQRVDNRYLQASAIKAKVKKSVVLLAAFGVAYSFWAAAIFVSVNEPAAKYLPLIIVAMTHSLYWLASRLQKNTEKRLPLATAISWVLTVLALVQFAAYVNDLRQGKSRSNEVAAVALKAIDTGSDEVTVDRFKRIMQWTQRVMNVASVIFPAKLAVQLKQLGNFSQLKKTQ